MQEKTLNDFTVPFSLKGVPQAEHFVGHESELEQIKQAFQGDGSERRIVVIHGLGGMGKTQLALKYARQNKAKYSAIFWLNGRSVDLLKQSFVSVASQISDVDESPKLRSAIHSKDADIIVKSVRDCLSQRNNIKCLLIFDNVDDPKLPDVRDGAYVIRDYFPVPDTGHILVTSRISDIRIGQRIRLRKLAST